MHLKYSNKGLYAGPKGLETSDLNYVLKENIEEVLSEL